MLFLNFFLIPGLSNSRVGFTALIVLVFASFAFWICNNPACQWRGPIRIWLIAPRASVGLPRVWARTLVPRLDTELAPDLGYLQITTMNLPPLSKLCSYFFPFSFPAVVLRVFRVWEQVLPLPWRKLCPPDDRMRSVDIHITIVCSIPPKPWFISAAYHLFPMPRQLAHFQYD